MKILLYLKTLFDVDFGLKIAYISNILAAYTNLVIKFSKISLYIHISRRKPQKCSWRWLRAREAHTKNRRDQNS